MCTVREPACVPVTVCVDGEAAASSGRRSPLDCTWQSGWQALSCSVWLRRLASATLLLAVATGSGYAQRSPVGGVDGVFAGGSHTCLLDNEGLACFGANASGQLGTGGFTDQTAPVGVSGLDGGVVSAALGSAHSCALRSGGEVVCWGANDKSQLGRSGAGSATPIPVGGLGEIVRIGSGYGHTCAVTSAGAARCWGDNANGQLGDGTTLGRSAPVAVNGLSIGVAAIATGLGHSCALNTDGSVRCWGNNEFGQLGDGTFTSRPAPIAVGVGGVAIAIALGDNHSCVVLTDGRVRCWGQNARGQLGIGISTDQSSPAAFVALEGPAEALTLGSEYSCAVLALGGLSCWGRNDRGQLGDGTTLQRPTPVIAIGLPTSLPSAAAGSSHTCATTGSSGLLCWGDNTFGQLGDGTAAAGYAPIPVSGLVDILRAIAVGDDHSCAVTFLGGVKCWGDNSFGQLGDGALVDRQAPVDVQRLASGQATVGLGATHSCAVSLAGALQCWGRNNFGQLGDGTTTDRHSPVAVQGLSGGVRSAEGGLRHTCLLTTEGGVKCWGDNQLGQLGDGSLTRRLAPTDVVGLTSGVQTISASVNHTCAVTAIGAVVCWGDNSQGQLGDGTTENRSTPVVVTGLGNGFRSVTAGRFHSCAASNSGAILCWGNNFQGQLGDGSTTRRLQPVNVQGLPSGQRDVVAGFTHNCAVSDLSGVRCWGRNDRGELGDGSSLRRTTTVAVGGLSGNVLKLALGSQHSCVMLVTGGARCWGSDQQGQLGDGGRDHARAEPVVSDNLAVHVERIPTVGDARGDAAVTDSAGDVIVFQTRAASGGASEIFRYDRRDGSSQRVSLDNAGHAIAGEAIEPTLSGDGLLLAFVAPDAAVTRLFRESPNKAVRRIKSDGWGVFLRNLATGTTQRLGGAVAGGEGTSPQIASTGAAIVFTSTNNDPALGVTGRNEIMFVPLQSVGTETVPGPISCPSCKSVDSAGRDTNTSTDGPSKAATVSADGSMVAWQTTAKNSLAQAPAPCPASSSEVILRNMATGQSQHANAPPSPAGCGEAGAGSGTPQLDASGQQVVFQSTQPLHTSDDNTFSDIYMFDTTNRQTALVSSDVEGTVGNGPSTDPTISGDGKTVAFVSAAQNLDPREADNNETSDIHVRSTEGRAEVRRLTKNTSGDQADAAGARPALSFFGSVLVFDSDASNLASGSELQSVFVRTNPLVEPEVRSATWWVEQESGWGMAIFDQGNTLAPAWFTYDSGDGKPTWFLISGAFLQDDGSYRGDLFRFTGVPFDRIDGNAVISSTPLGSVSLRFSGDNRLFFQYTVNGETQQKTMSRFPFPQRLSCRRSVDPARTAVTNFSDIWWGGPNTPGWGLFINHVGETLFATWFTYDQDGRALFLIGSTAVQADGSYRGPLFRQPAGVPFNQIDGSPPSSSPSQVGEVSLRFDDGANGVFAYRVGSINQSKSITRLQVGEVASECVSSITPPN